MSIDYPSGTMATATYRGQRRRAFRYGGLSWMVITDNGAEWQCIGGRHLTDITPLVCIEATRADADRLQGLLPATTAWAPGHSTVQGIINAIREQTPEPEPRQAVVDALNAAEPS